MSELLPDPTEALLPFEALRRYTMCPLLEARSGGDRVVFARRSAVGKITFAWFDLAENDTAVTDCDLRTDVPDAAYRDFIAENTAELLPVSAEAAKSRLFRAVRHGEEAGRFPPKQFSWVAALLDGIELQDA